MLRAKQSAIVLAIFRSIDGTLAFFDHSTHGMHVFFATGMSATMENLALLPANATNSLALGVAVILNQGSSSHRLRNTEAFESGPDVAEQTRANAMQPSRILTAALEETTPARAEHALDRAERLLLNA